MGDALGTPIRRVDAPVGWPIRGRPAGAGRLASESRWNRIYRLDRIQRDIPEFHPTIALSDRAGGVVADLDRRGLIPDGRSYDTEDRHIVLAKSLQDSD